MNLAIIGAGWAGLAAAIAATQAGHQTTVFEAARSVGGRARALTAPRADGTPLVLDNGQHILIGAYTDGSGLQLPDLPPPWDALLGIARARGWPWRDRIALLRTAHGWQRAGFVCAPQDTVAALCSHLPQGLLDGFIDPLCVAALNTPAHAASGQVFLRVLQDSLFSGRGGSHLLLPRVDLGTLFPEAATAWLTGQGAMVRQASACWPSPHRPPARAGLWMAPPSTHWFSPPLAPRRRAWYRTARRPPPIP